MKNEVKLIDEQKWRRELEELTEEYERMLKLVEMSLASAPEGSLVTKTRQGKLECYWRKDQHLSYLSVKEQSLIRQLAQKDYSLKAQRTLQKLIKRNRYILQMELLPQMVSIVQQENALKNALIEPFITTEEDFITRWKKENYEGKPFKEDDPVICAKNGLRVRSKSETIIVDLLLEYQIPFKYECPIYLKGMGIIFPDLRVLNKRTGKEFIWEHFGMMDDYHYVNNALKKLETYHYNGFFEGKNLLCTFESSKSPFSFREAKRIVEQYLL